MLATVEEVGGLFHKIRMKQHNIEVVNSYVRRFKRKMARFNLHDRDIEIRYAECKHLMELMIQTLVRRAASHTNKSVHRRACVIQQDIRYLLQGC